MHRLIVSLTLVIVTAIACSGDAEPQAEPTEQPSTVPTRDATETPITVPGPTQSVGDVETIEVQGVVGAVDTRAGTIEIRATGGSSVTTIELATDATISRAGGGELTLEQVRPSDRISAEGIPGSDTTTLVAENITVQQVVPGGPPGANPGG